MCFLITSSKKTLAMQEITKLMNSRELSDFRSIIEYDEKESKAFEKLYSIMIKMPGYKEILTKHNASPDLLKALSSRIDCAGFGYHKREFLPIALLSFGAPLDYILENKASILNDEYQEIRAIVEAAIDML